MGTKQKSYLKKLLFIGLIFVLIFPIMMLSACSYDDDVEYVTSISKTDTTDNVDTYTVTYSDGTTTTFTITNGEDGDDVSIGDIYTYCCENGIFDTADYEGDEDAAFCAFLKAYLSNSSESVSSSTAKTKALCSAVSVYSFFPRITTRGYTFYSSTRLLNVSSGAGVVYLMEGTYSYIITCYHVVYSASTVTSNGIASEIYLFQYGDNVDCCDEDAFSYYFSDYTTPQVTTSGISATYVGGSANYDLAVLQVETASLASWTQEVEIASGYDLGDTVYAVGNPESEGISVTEGMINVLSEYISIEQDNGTTYTYRVLRTDTAVNGGNSGGGLFNAKGEFVGIVNAKIKDSTVDNMAYAIPYDNVVKVVENILANMTDGVSTGVNKLTIGVTVQKTNSRAEETISGALVIYDDAQIYEVSEDSLAESIGLQAGDVLKSVTIIRNGEETTYDITSFYMLSEALLDVRVGDSILFKFSRNGIINYAYIASASTDNFSIVA